MSPSEAKDRAQEQWTAVDDYIDRLLVRPDALMSAVLEACAEAGLPPIGVTPNQGKLLMLLAQMQGARRILEIGTLGGYSSIWLARGLADGGRLVTLEAIAKHAEVARANFARAGLTDTVELRLGPAADSLAALVRERAAPFDFIFIDANKDGYAEYFAWAMKLSRVGTVIVADNVVQEGRVTDQHSDDERVQGIRKFMNALAIEPRVTATAIQTVGSKDYDGFAVIRVEAQRDYPR